MDDETMIDTKEYTKETKADRLNAYDLRLKLLNTAVKDFAAKKPKMSQGEKWEAFDLMAEEFYDVVERKKLIDLVNAIIRAKK